MNTFCGSSEQHGGMERKYLCTEYDIVGTQTMMGLIMDAICLLFCDWPITKRNVREYSKHTDIVQRNILLWVLKLFRF